MDDFAQRLERRNPFTAIALNEAQFFALHHDTNVSRRGYDPSVRCIEGEVVTASHVASSHKKKKHHEADDLDGETTEFESSDNSASNSSSVELERPRSTQRATSHYGTSSLSTTKVNHRGGSSPINSPYASEKLNGNEEVQNLHVPQDEFFEQTHDHPWTRILCKRPMLVKTIHQTISRDVDWIDETINRGKIHGAVSDETGIQGLAAAQSRHLDRPRTANSPSNGKSRARRVDPTLWERYRTEIAALYVTERMRLSEVVKFMRSEHRFEAT